MTAVAQGRNGAAGPALLEVKDLSVTFGQGDKAVRALDRASFTIEPGRTHALVGESGSGKSVTALSILQLLPYPVASHPAGSSIRFRGEELVGASEHRLRDVRGNQVAMVFQGFALFPWLTVLGNVELGLEAQGVSAAERRRRAVDARSLR